MKRRGSPPRRGPLAWALCLAATLFPSCKDRPEERTVSVLYAGSLAAVMENGLGPAFTKATGYAYKGEAQGSLGAAHMIRDHVRSPDVFISADPLVNEAVLMGSKNGDLVTWFVVMASSQLVLGYSPKSPVAAKLEPASGVPWYEVLETPGVRFGRGDPTIDPKGYRSIFLFDLAAKHYHRPELVGFLGEPRNPAQVFPEIVLLARLESGQLDAGIFYKHEAVAHHLPIVSFPPEINLSEPRFAESYAQATFASPAGERFKGAPILFTITIPKTVRHQAAAEAFVQFVLTAGAQMEELGLGKVDHRVGGDAAQVPPSLRALASGAFTP